jgi:hypothetical protein
MGLLDKLKKKKKEVPIPEEFIPRELPDDLERLRADRPTLPSAYEPRYPEVGPRYPEIPRPEPVERPLTPVIPPREPADKLDMILQKLETIDARLKLIEERVRRP